MGLEDGIKTSKGISLVRLAKTPFSEGFGVCRAEELLGQYYLHYAKDKTDTLILEKNLAKDEVRELVSRIDDNLSSFGLHRNNSLECIYDGKVVCFVQTRN